MKFFTHQSPSASIPYQFVYFIALSLPVSFPHSLQKPLQGLLWQMTSLQVELENFSYVWQDVAWSSLVEKVWFV